MAMCWTPGPLVEVEVLLDLRFCVALLQVSVDGET